MKAATFKKVFDNDSNPSIALAWVGDDGNTLLAATTYESFVAYPSTLYRSTDGGKNFENITKSIGNEYIRRKNGVLTATVSFLLFAKQLSFFAYANYYNKFSLLFNSL